MKTGHMTHETLEEIQSLPGQPKKMRAFSLGSRILAIWRLFIYAIINLVFISTQMVLRWVNGEKLGAFAVFYHRICCRILGIYISIKGQPSPHRPTLYVANHTSYVDIISFASLMPISFVSKAEVGKWPIFGLLARLQRTVFIDRQRKNTGIHRNSMADRLQEGDSLMLFAEGTTNDGNRLFPFRSSLLSAAETKLIPDDNVTHPYVMVQPVSIAYTHLNGLPLGYSWRYLIAWYGDVGFGEHIWQLLRLGKIRVLIEFHEPVNIHQFKSRKEMTDYCFQQVQEGFQEAITGRQASPLSNERGKMKG
ncbi:MAG: 1-acyl-sn-glycerol-3-phosphate acyltransferase [Rhodospirillaceae bacterium]|nr:1-acyl-sn-glycerol-3-phosphate acyltransferase [Rhodospirillaceae bacterium]